MSSSKIQEYNLDPNCGFAKEDTAQEILSQMGQGVTANVVKSVQRGLAKTNDSGYINVPISSVNLEKTFARISNVLANTNDDKASHGTTNNIGTDGYLINSTTLHIIAGGFTKDKYVAWEVIEFY